MPGLSLERIDFLRERIRMKFKSIQGEMVHIAGTPEDCQDLYTLVDTAENKSGYDMLTYGNVSPERAAKALEELTDNMANNEIIISIDAISDVDSILCTLESLDLDINRIAKISKERFITLKEAMRNIYEQAIKAMEEPN